MKTYPEYIEVKGVRYKLDTSFKTALRCMELTEDSTISDQERALAVIYLLLDEIPEGNLEDIISLLKKYLERGREKGPTNNEKDMDLMQDEAYIASSFMYDYGIDLTKSDMHWWKFIDLLDGLSSECILSRVRDIRTMDISQYKDPKTRERLLRARRHVALKQKEEPQTEEEKKAEALFEARLKGSNTLDPDDYLLEDEEG